MKCGNTNQRAGGGFAYIVGLIVLTMLMVLAVAFVAATDTNLSISNNCRSGMDAQLAAESGLAFMLERLRSVRLPNETTHATFASDLLAGLAQVLNGTANLAGQAVTNDGTTISVPDIQTDNGTFRCWFSWIDDKQCRLVVQGSARQLQRRVAMELALEIKRPLVFDYGLASRGQITISGNAKILGVNHPWEASVLSATQLHNDAIRLDGGVTVDGDLYTAGQDTYITLEGSPTVAGTTDPEEMAEHFHEGVDTPDFPQIETSHLVPLAVNVIDANTNLSAGVYNNIRIAAGTNPDFTSDVVLNGVVYVEAPNIVRFRGQTTINGLIVTQDKDLPLELCQLDFAGGVHANGVELLPDTSEFTAVKEYTGSFIIAPGFGAVFSGNFGTVNGAIAADQLTFAGTAEGTVNGTVIGLEDLPTMLGGNVIIRVNREGDGSTAAGFLESFALIPQPESYSELAGE